MDEKGPVPVHFRQTANGYPDVSRDRVPRILQQSKTLYQRAHGRTASIDGFQWGVCGSGSTFQSLISALSVLGILMLLVKPKR
jgi:hypothetical protein